MKMNCLNCEYEPTWSEWTGGESSRCSGPCRWDGEIPKLPATMIISVKHVIRYRDDSGIETRCKAWKGK